MKIHPNGSSASRAPTRRYSGSSPGPGMDESLDELLGTILQDEAKGESTSKIEAQMNAWFESATGVSSPSVIGVDEIKCAFQLWESRRKHSDEEKEYAVIETFISQEQNLGRGRRKHARLLEEREELRLAFEVAELKDFHLQRHSATDDAILQNKVSDAERSYMGRKMVVTKAAHRASVDCRMQFARVRAFFERLHISRQEALRQSYQRSLKVQAIMHRLKGTDPRVIALEHQTAERMYRKKEGNLNELHMAQNLEESVYLESIMQLLLNVQETKEKAATEVFDVQVKDLSLQRESMKKREKEMNDLRAEATLEMAQIVAHYVEEGAQNDEDDNQRDENVAKTERNKDFRADSLNSVVSVNELYDSIVWPVATGSIGLSSTTGSSLYSYDNLYGDEGKEDEVVTAPEGNDQDLSEGAGSVHWEGGVRDDASAQSDDEALSSIGNIHVKQLQTIGNIHVKQLQKKLKLKESSLLKKHKGEERKERRKYRLEYQGIKRKNQMKLDMLLNQCLEERHRLRDDVTNRMNALAQNQELSTKTVQESIDQDMKAMQDALVEYWRLELAEKSSFDKAQALISAQVFHEVRNALSSVVAMSEMTSTLREDSSMLPSELFSYVNDMLLQNGVIVNYALNMLNNVMDISKMKSGEFETKKEAFDLQHLVQQATTMQLVKAEARGVKMNCIPPPGRCIAYTDPDIVSRIITNFISNAVKFTDSGAIQPFVLPAKELLPSLKVSMQISNGKQLRMMAVGVADTGCGLSREVLNLAEAGLFNSVRGTSNGAKNSGFGLHLAHQLATSIGTRLHLVELAKCHNLFCRDVADSYKQYMSSVATLSGNAIDIPPVGTVLFVVVPVFEDEFCGLQLLDGPNGSNENQFLEESVTNGGPVYKFSPQPNPSSGTFRILIADDVLMLRKGLVRSILQVFKQFECPVSIYTSCSAEDMTRLYETLAFDLVISDNQFCQPDGLTAISSHYERPRILSAGESKPQNVMSDFFRSEAFTIEKNDGDLSGMNALLHFLEKPNQPHQTPILILLSGHTFDVDPSCGMIVLKKPIKTREIVTVLESNVARLLNAGVCVMDESSSAILNQHGTQIFTVN